MLITRARIRNIIFINMQAWPPQPEIRGSISRSRDRLILKVIFLKTDLKPFKKVSLSDKCLK